MINFDEALKILLSIAEKKEYAKKTTLLVQGDICKEIFIIEQGCLRSWLNDYGNDITFQFYFENEIAISFESFQNNQPALFNIETITPVSAYVIQKADFSHLLEKTPSLNDFINDFIIQRFYHYQRLFISRIKNSPQQRYEELIEENPEIFDRVAHHYIATYLGITSVSLSRIRNKKE
jgi:CRP-like cAMP-binding protein